MKKLFALFLFFPVLIFSQKTYKEFNVWDYKMELSVVVDGKSKGEVYMNYEEDGTAAMSFKDSEQRLEFADFLSTTYTKFKDWKKTALENNVKELVKEIDNGRFGSAIAFRYGKWQFSFGKHDLSAKMFITKEGKVYYVVSFPSVKSSSNEYIEQDAVNWVINDEEDVKNLISYLSDEVVNEFLNSQNNKDDLFN